MSGSAATRQRPTLEEIKTRWPATVNVEKGSDALGCSRAHLYEAIKRGDAPVRTLRVGRRIVVVTASIVAALDS